MSITSSKLPSGHWRFTFAIRDDTISQRRLILPECNPRNQPRGPVRSTRLEGLPSPKDQNEPSQNEPSDNEPIKNDPSENDPSENDPNEIEPSENENELIPTFHLP